MMAAAAVIDELGLGRIILELFKIGTAGRSADRDQHIVSLDWNIAGHPVR
jgi:hypothetical protein